MKLLTKEFGEIIVEEADMIKFIEGIYGFEKYTRYVILKDAPEDDIMYLQSVDNPDLHFVLVEPYIILPNYSPELSFEDINTINVSDDEIINLKFLLIAVISERIENSVVNLRSPIVINPGNKHAIQAILQNQDYPLRYPLFKRDGEDSVSN